MTGKRRYYRCTKKHSVSSDGEQCTSRSVQADRIEEAVWSAVSDTLGRPEVLVAEYQRRIEQESTEDNLVSECKKIELALKRVAVQENRITDAYVNEVMELDRYRSEMDKLRSRRRGLEREQRDIERQSRQKADNRDALRHMAEFCSRVSEGLEALRFDERQRLLRLVVERITLADNRVRVETIIPTGGDGVKLRTRRGERVEPRTPRTFGFWDGFQALSRSSTRFLWASTRAVWSGQTTVVESSCSTMAGPVTTSPGLSRERA